MVGGSKHKYVYIFFFKSQNFIIPLEKANNVFAVLPTEIDAHARYYIMHAFKCMFICLYVQTRDSERNSARANGSKQCLCLYMHAWVGVVFVLASADQVLPGFVPLPYSVPVKNLSALHCPLSILTSLMEPQSDLSCR